MKVSEVTKHSLIVTFASAALASASAALASASAAVNFSNISAPSSVIAAAFGLAGTISLVKNNIKPNDTRDFGSLIKGRL